MRNEIEADFFAIATALELDLDDSFANAVFVSYLAGEIPTEVLHVPGKLTELIKIDSREAQRLLEIARGALQSEEKTKQNEKQTISQELAATGSHLPKAQLLLRLLSPLTDIPGFDDTAKLVINAHELPKRTTIPASWRELLVAQEQTKPMPWESVWTNLEGAMPAVFTFLRKKCFGVGILLRKDYSPALVYFLRFPSDELDVGYKYGAYLGEMPLGKRTPKGTKEILALLPSQFLHFYREVHDGWRDILLDVHGPLPVEQLSFLGRDVMQEDTEILVDTALVLMRLRGGGDTFCLATEKAGEKPKAHVYRSQWDDEVNKDCFKTFNKLLRIAIQEFLTRTK
jgi:hypothetical protein